MKKKVRYENLIKISFPMMIIGVVIAVTNTAVLLGGTLAMSGALLYGECAERIEE